MFSRNRITVLVGSVLAMMAMHAQAGSQGPSSSLPPYLNAIASGVELTSILTVGDNVRGYTMVGIPDGLGAYDNEDSTFTVLMNHEIYATASGPIGIVRAHGGKGTFVSEWVIDKRTLAVKSGQVGRSRLWALNFTDSSRPELGGTIEMLLDGTGIKGDYQMFDNITVSEDGTLILLEDVGNNQHNGKIWKFDPADGTLVKLAGFDPALFGDIGLTGTITKDEESSGVIDITDILDRDDAKMYHLLVAQSHAPSGNPETVEGGQLLLMSQPAPEHDNGDGHSSGHKK